MNQSKWVSSSTYCMPGIPRENLSLEVVIADVCDVLNVDSSLVYAKYRNAKVKCARWFIWKIMRSHGYSYQQCGDLFDMDHSTVINCMVHIDYDIENITYIFEAWEKVKKHFKQPVKKEV